METVAAMIQLSPSVSGHDSALPPTAEQVSAARAELYRLLSRRVKLSNDIARMRRLLRRLVRNANSHRLGGRSREEYLSTGRSTSPDRRRRPIAKSTLRQSPRNVRSTGPLRSELARACTARQYSNAHLLITCLLNLVHNEKMSMRFCRSQRLSAARSSLRGCCANLLFAWLGKHQERVLPSRSRQNLGACQIRQAPIHDLAIWLEAQLQAELQVARVQRGDSFAE